MIRFACPNCNKVYKANDDQEGKKSLCKQCGCYVLIPKPITEGLTGVPLPPEDVPPSVELPVDDIPPPARRPDLRRPNRERDRGRTEGDDEWDDRRRDRRPRNRPGDPDDDQPIRHPVQGVAVAAAVINFIFAVVALCGACFGGVASVASMRERPDPPVQLGNNTVAGLVFLGCGLLNLVGVGLMIMTGIGLLIRQRYGRTLGLLSAGLGLVNVLGVFIILMATAIVDISFDAETILGCLIPGALWLAYAISCLILLGKVRPQPR